MKYDIFCTVGTHPQPFNRLLEELDEVCAKRKWKCFAQVGNTAFAPKHLEWKKMLDAKAYDEKLKESKIVISHGGAGNIINALVRGKKLVVVPRLQKFGEHTNDHQLELGSALERQGKCVCVQNVEGLEKAVERAKHLKQSRRKELPIAKRISEFIEELE
ncbi:MAG: glycosyltransferase [Candidatus Diapherotrites archaeon]